MHFKVNQIGKLRLGTLEFSHAPPLETPNCLLMTKNNYVPHLTLELIQKLDHPYFLFDLENIVGEFRGEIIHELPDKMPQFFLTKGLKNSASILTIHQPLLQKKNEIPFNGDKFVTLSTEEGNKKVTWESFEPYLKQFDFDLIMPLCDFVIQHSDLKLKRVKKSIDRSLNFLNQTLAQVPSEKVLGVLLGANHEEERKKNALELESKNLAGYILETTDSLPLLPFKHISKEKPRFYFNIKSIPELFDAVEAGVDVFDSTMLYEWTEQGKAFQADKPLELLDLKDKAHNADTGPLIKDCICFSCQNHAKAYIHHLLNVHEILAKTLLMMHNQFQYLAFFKEIRQSIKESNFQSFKEKILSRSSIKRKLESE